MPGSTLCREGLSAPRRPQHNVATWQSPGSTLRRCCPAYEVGRRSLEQRRRTRFGRPRTTALLVRRWDALADSQASQKVGVAEEVGSVDRHAKIRASGSEQYPSDEFLEQEQTEETEKRKILCFLCFLLFKCVPVARSLFPPPFGGPCVRFEPLEPCQSCGIGYQLVCFRGVVDLYPRADAQKVEHRKATLVSGDTTRRQGVVRPAP